VAAISVSVVHRTRTYADVRAVLGSDEFTTTCPAPEGDTALDTTILASDGSAHTAIQRIWAAWFSTAHVEASSALLLRPVVAGTWRGLRGQGRVDLIASFAGEVAPRVIFGMLGLPHDVGADAYRTTIVTVAAFRADRGTHRAKALEAHARLVEMLSPYQHVLCPEGRLPADVTPAQFLDALAVVLQLATETTVCAIANLFFLLAEHPDSWGAVLDGRLAARCFVDEVLRFEPASGHLFRFASMDTRLPSGAEVPRDATMVMNLREANLTETRLETPERWEPAAGRGAGLSFGFGTHACAGRALALALLVEIVDELTRSRFSATMICERDAIEGVIFRRPSRLVAML
jgi:cytochrome P450